MNTYSLRKIIPITSYLLGFAFILLGIFVILLSESVEVTEVLIFCTCILSSGPWFLLGRLGLRTIKIEENVFQEYGEIGVKELRENHQAFSWKSFLKKNTQQVDGSDVDR